VRGERGRASGVAAELSSVEQRRFKLSLSHLCVQNAQRWGTPITDDLGIKLEKVRVGDLGQAKKSVTVICDLRPIRSHA